MASPLLPSPFCGGEDGRYEVLLEHVEVGGSVGIIPRLRCSNPLCGAMMDGWNDLNAEPVANLVAAWNLRKAAPATPLDASNT